MDRFEFEFLKTVILDQPEISFREVSSICELMKSKFNFGDYDVCEILYKCPQILETKIILLKENIEKLEKKFSLLSSRIKYFVLKFPFLLLVKSELLEYKIGLISTLFAISKTEAIEKLILCPDLLFVGKEEIKNKTIFLSKELNEFCEGVRRISRDYPEVLFLEEEKIKRMKKVLIEKFTFSENQVNKIFKTCPEVLFFSVEKLEDLYDFYYPRYFVKRDLKEIFSSCPEMFKLTKAEFERKICTIEDSLHASEKEALNFVRSCPNSMLFGNLKTKFEGLKKFNINMEFVKAHPSLFLIQEFTIPLKFVFARILGIESEFERLCLVNTKTFVSRFLFMQAKRIYSHEDLLLEESEFFEKYRISSDVLKICYVISEEKLRTICEYYVNLKGRLPNWTDIVFPRTKDIENFIKEKLRQNVQNVSFESVREEFNFTRRQHKLLPVFFSLYLDNDECLYLIRKCKSLTGCCSSNIHGIFHFLRKQGFSFESLVKLLLEKPTIFTYFVGDFESMFLQTMKFYHCKPQEAIEYIC